MNPKTHLCLLNDVQHSHQLLPGQAGHVGAQFALFLKRHVAVRRQVAQAAGRQVVLRVRSAWSEDGRKEGERDGSQAEDWWWRKG